jgi:hypothetical protein
MSDAATAAADRELQMLGPMVECAYALGMVFGEAAKAQDDLAVQLQLFDAFHRSFQAVRLGIRLSMTLRAPPRAATPGLVERAEREALEIERPEPIESERLEAERERDRDYEPVSLPRFLATLGVVAADAERLPTDAAADTVSTLKGLLARAKPDPAAPAARPSAAVNVLARPTPAPDKAALLGSTSAPLLRPAGLRSPSRPRPPPAAPRAR